MIIEAIQSARRRVVNSTLEAEDRHVEGMEKVEVAEPRVSPVVVNKVGKLLLWTELRELRTSLATARKLTIACLRNSSSLATVSSCGFVVFS